MTSSILSFLEGLLGSSKPTTGTNHEFFCPVCNHRKRKLSIDLDTMKWHCWVCSRGGLSLFTLLKYINASKSSFSQLSELIGNRTYYRQEKKQKHFVHSLPREYQNIITHSGSMFARAAINYLVNQRGLTANDLIKYNIGYCISGEFDEMVIFPSYDRHGKLNFFTARDFMGNYIKHKNPKASKNIVGFELFVNWDMPIVLVEAALDAITVRHNAIPLFGKTLNDILISEIVNKRPPMVIILLDPDAYDNSIEIAEIIMGMNIPVKLVKLQDEDANEMGHDAVWEAISNTKTLTNSHLFKEQVNQILHGSRKSDFSRKRHTLPSLSTAFGIPESFRKLIPFYRKPE